jgi:hypothetical protein
MGTLCLEWKVWQGLAGRGTGRQREGWSEQGEAREAAYEPERPDNPKGLALSDLERKVCCSRGGRGSNVARLQESEQGAVCLRCLQTVCYRPQAEERSVWLQAPLRGVGGD